MKTSRVFVNSGCSRVREPWIEILNLLLTLWWGSTWSYWQIPSTLSGTCWPFPAWRDERLSKERYDIAKEHRKSFWISKTQAFGYRALSFEGPQGVGRPWWFKGEIKNIPGILKTCCWVREKRPDTRVYAIGFHWCGIPNQAKTNSSVKNQKSD